MAYKIGDLLQSKYDCDLHISPSPVPDSSMDNDEDKGGRRKPPHFVENQTTRKIAICPGCIYKKHVTRT
jgi:hypothetical protein